RLREDGEDSFVGDQEGIGVGIPCGQVNEATVNAALKCLGAANTLNHAVANRFAGVFDFFYTSSECESSAGANHGLPEFEFQGRCFVPDAPTHFVSAADDAFDRRTHGQDNFVLTNEVLREDGVNQIACLCGVGGDGCGEANPKRLTHRYLVAAESEPGGEGDA